MNIEKWLDQAIGKTHYINCVLTGPQKLDKPLMSF